MDKCQITVQYNDIIKTFNIYNYDTLGSIFEHIMNKFNLYIYSLETIKCIISNSENSEIKTIDFKTEYDNFNMSLSDCITEDNCNVKFIMFDRDRDENGNVIKNNNFIDKYNTFLALVNDQSMARNLQNQYDRYIKYNNILNNLSNSRTSLSNSLLNMFNIPLTTTTNNQTPLPLQTSQPGQEQPTQNEEQETQSNQSIQQNEDINQQNNNNQMGSNIINIANSLFGDSTSINDESNNELINDELNNESNNDQLNTGTQNTVDPTQNNNTSQGRFAVNSSNIYDISGNPQLTYEFTINSIFPNQSYNIPNYGRNLYQYSTSNPSQFTFQTANSSGSSVGSQSNYNQTVNNLYTSFFNLINSRFNIPAQQMADVKMVLTTEELDKLKVMTYKEYKDDLEEGTIVDDNSKCPISLQKFEDEDIIIKLKCGHIFKSEYIKEWLSESSNKCPVCREEVAKGIPNHEVNSE